MVVDAKFIMFLPAWILLGLLLQKQTFFIDYKIGNLKHKNAKWGLQDTKNEQRE